MGSRDRERNGRPVPRSMAWRGRVLLGLAMIGCAAALLGCGEPGPLREVPLAEAHEQKLSGVLVEARGKVKFVLSDDTRGALHQRLLVELPEGFRVKITHDIDASTRVPTVVGERVEFRGVYSFDGEGGVVHGTHKDPDGKRPAGWIRHRGRVYE